MVYQSTSLGTTSNNRLMPIHEESLVTGGDDHFLPKLIKEINAATRIDIAVSFIRASGLTLIKTALEDALAADVSIRIVTGGYLYITEPKALRMLMILQE